MNIVNELDPNISLIDRYLRGELNPEELSAFMTKLQTDADFKKQVELQEQLAAMVYGYGKAQLKQYIRQQTKHRRIFKLSQKTWYYAAASVILVAMMAAIVYVKLNQAGHIGNAVVKQTGPTNDSNVAKEGNLAVTEPKEQHNVDQPKQSETDVLKEEWPPIDDDIQTEAMEGVDEPPPTEVALLIAQNIYVVPINKNTKSLTENRGDAGSESDNMKAAQVRKPERMKASSTQVAEPFKDTALQGKQAIAKKSVTRFSLSFYESKDKEKGYYVVKEPNLYRINCYNMPFGDPLIYEWSNRFFLQSAGVVYELNLGVNNLQNAIPVTDAKIIGLIGK